MTTSARRSWHVVLTAAVLLASACRESSNVPPPPEPIARDESPAIEETTKPGVDVTVVAPSELVPPPVAPPCKPGRCPFAGQTVTILGFKGQPVTGPVHELKQEFEAATGAALNVVEVSFNEHFDNFISDVTNQIGKFDATIAGAWWIGELVDGDFIVPYDKYYNDPRFPKWDIDEVLPAPRDLLSYQGKNYMVANDHDGMVMYYRRDLLSDPRHQAAFKQKYGYALGVPATWDQFRDVADYFNGKDLNGDRVPDHGVSLHLRVGEQSMFHYMSFSAPFVIGPDNPRLYWFDPQTMKPLLESPGHVRALQALTALTQFGPKQMADWDIGKSWDYFLAGRAALTFTWGNVGGLAQEPGSAIKGKCGVAQLPGTREYYSIAQKQWVKTARPNRVANVTGGSWAGVISKYSKSPEATYYLLALMAHKDKSIVYAARGWDGLDPGRVSHFLPPNGSAKLETYLKFGWNEADIRDYSQAFFENFNNELQLPFLRIPGTFSYWRALDVHLSEAVKGQLSAEAALRATAVDFEEITIRLGRERQLRSYLASLQR